MNHSFMMDMNEYYNILLSIYIMDAVILRWITILWWIWMNITIFCYPLYNDAVLLDMNHYFMMDMNEYYNILLSIYIMDAVLLRWITIL
jgi:hypothetical protein